MTTILDIDVGNSRVKWRYTDGREQRDGAFSRESGWLDSSWRRGFRPARVRISSVAGRPAETELKQTLVRRFAVPVQFARPTRFRAGVTCAYRNPRQMGVDRWLSLLAAWQLVRGPLMVVGVGTAATLDVVDHTGAHRGGYIVPGMRSLVRALEASTAQVQVEVGAGHRIESLRPGLDTRECVERGTALMLFDFIEQSIARFLKCDEHCASIFVTGGDAQTVSAHLESPHRCLPHLVLDGLAVALP